jgi:hypothetical protein
MRFRPHRRGLVAIFAERLGDRLLGNPDMIDMIVEVHNTLDLIVTIAFIEIARLRSSLFLE